ELSPPLPLLVRQREILVGCGIRVAGNQAEPGFPNPRTGAVEKGQLPQVRVDRPIVHDLLDLMERRFAPRVVELRRLLREQRVDVRIAAVGIGAVLRDECLEAGRGVAEGAARALEQVLANLLRLSPVTNPARPAVSAWRGCGPLRGC